MTGAVNELGALATEVTLAAERIRPYVRRTALEISPALSSIGSSHSSQVFLKLENTQTTGSFKLRGAFNKLLTLSEPERKRGVVAASTGNHGMAVAFVGKTLNCPVTVFVPENSSPSKVERIRELGAEVRQVGDDGIIAERAARAHAESEGLAYLSPYNDPAVIAGQGTLAVELLEQLPECELDRIYIALGGGGLLSGIASYLHTSSAKAEIIACSPKNSAVMHHSLEAGHILDLASEPTLSDGTAGGVEQSSITFDLCRQMIDRSLLISEDQIRDAIRLIVGRHQTLIEGSAGVAVAGYVMDSENGRSHRSHRERKETIAIVLCGANIAAATLKEIL